MTFFRSNAFHVCEQIFIGSVWVFHGVYSKLMNGIPRHRLIVAKVLGPSRSTLATRTVGLMALMLGVWAYGGWQSIWSAAIQTIAIVAMNTLEIIFARELLISGPGMVLLNIGFLSLVWNWAVFASGN